MKVQIICFYLTSGKIKIQNRLIWPVWMDAFLLSCKYNTQLEWLIFSDCESPKSYPSNVRFLPFSLKDFNALASSKLGFNINVQNNHNGVPRKIYDFRPAFGIIFEDYLKGYDWWGHVDLDVILGSIDSFIKPYDFEHFELISSRKNALTGSFTLYKNTKKINELFKLIDKYDGPFFSPGNAHMPNRGTYQHLWSLPDNQLILERNMNQILRSNPGLVKTKLDKHLFNFSSDRVNARSANISDISKEESPWVWVAGSLLWKGKEEVMYAHFPPYRNSIKYITFSYEDDPDGFILTPDSILAL